MTDEERTEADDENEVPPLKIECEFGGLTFAENV